MRRINTAHAISHVKMEKRVPSDFRSDRRQELRHPDTNFDDPAVIARMPMTV